MYYFARRNNIFYLLGFMGVRGYVSRSRDVIVWLEGDNIIKFMDQLRILQNHNERNRMTGVF